MKINCFKLNLTVYGSPNIIPESSFDQKKLAEEQFRLKVRRNILRRDQWFPKKRYGQITLTKILKYHMTFLK